MKSKKRGQRGKSIQNRIGAGQRNRIDFSSALCVFTMWNVNVTALGISCIITHKNALMLALHISFLYIFLFVAHIREIRFIFGGQTNGSKTVWFIFAMKLLLAITFSVAPTENENSWLHELENRKKILNPPQTICKCIISRRWTYEKNPILIVVTEIQLMVPI